MTTVRFRSFVVIVILLRIGRLDGQITYVCLNNSTCGCSTNSAILSKIVGGEPASNETWNWIVSIRLKRTNSHICGGSIISDSHILTAAHCTVPYAFPSLLRIYIGSIYVHSAGQIRDVSKIFNHQFYSSVDYLNDISILKLSTPLNLNHIGIGKICLPFISSSILETDEYPSPGINLVAIGWGQLNETDQNVSPILQQVTIQSIAASSSFCRNIPLLNASIQFCAGVMPFGGKDTCQGDSGGPLMMFTSNRVWEQVGIVSSGVGCARPNYPGIYTRVAAYQNWIQDTINGVDHVHAMIHQCLVTFLFILFLF